MEPENFSTAYRLTKLNGKLIYGLNFSLNLLAVHFTVYNISILLIGKLQGVTTPIGVVINWVSLSQLERI